MYLLATNTLSNQDISPATVGTTGLLTLTHTASAARYLFARIFLDQVAGNGTYTVYMTIQRGGAGSAYEYDDRTAVVVPSGVTAWTLVQSPRILSAGDVLKVYVIGLSGDTATPDIITELFEDDSLVPITAAQNSVDIDASGRVNLGKWLGTTPDALSSGKVAADLKLWLATAPLALSSQLVQVLDSSGIATLLGRLTATRAGYLDYLDSRLDIVLSTVKTVVDAIQAKTDNLPADPADESLLEAAISAAQSAITTETDAIQAKTDLIPASPAAVGSQMDLVNAPNATAVTAIQSGLATAANLTTLINRVGAWTGTGRNTLLGAFQSLFRKDTDAIVPSDVNADLGSGAGAASNLTDSLEAIRDRGDAAWTGGGAAPTVTQIRQEMDSNSTQLAAIKAKTDSLTFTVAGKVDANTTHVSGDSAAADNAEAFFDGTGYAGTGNTIPTVTNLTNAPPNSAGVTTLLAIFAGWSGTLLTALRSLARKDVESVDLGGTYDPATDSQEALREKVDELAAEPPEQISWTVNEDDG